MENLLIENEPVLIEDTIVFKDKNKFYVYGQKNQLVTKIEKFDSGIISELGQKGFFKNKDCFPINQIPQKRYNLMLLLSRNCYLSCRYCYANSGKNELMSKEITEQAINLYLKSNPSNPRINLFGGGEPTYNISVIRHIINKYEPYGIRWILTTCGIMHESFLEWLISKNVSIGFSIDGPPYIQDYLRPLRSGEPSSKFVEKSIRIYKEKSSNGLSVRTTITGETVSKIEQILDYFDKLGVDVLHLESLYNLGRATSEEQKGILSAPKISEFVNAVTIALDWAKRKKKRIKIGCLSYLFDMKSPYYCGPICGKTIVVNHKGFLTACSEVVDESDNDWNKFCIGKMNNSCFMFFKEKTDCLLNLITESIHLCNSCFLKNICRGGCAHKNISATGRFDLPNTQHCEFLKIMIPILIKRMVDNNYYLLNKV